MPEIGPEVRDCGREKNRIVRMRPRNQGIETVPPMGPAQEEKTCVEIPDCESVPTFTVRMDCDAEGGVVDGGGRGDCE